MSTYREEYYVYVNETLVEGSVWLTPDEAKVFDAADGVRILWTGRSRGQAA